MTQIGHYQEAHTILQTSTVLSTLVLSFWTVKSSHTKMMTFTEGDSCHFRTILWTWKYLLPMMNHILDLRLSSCVYWGSTNSDKQHEIQMQLMTAQISWTEIKKEMLIYWIRRKKIWILYQTSGKHTDRFWGKKSARQYWAFFGVSKCVMVHTALVAC